jgi:hypothetical protein
MPAVLTESSTLTCAHTGAVQLIAGQSKLTVNGSKVLVDGDLSDKLIDGCVTVPDPTTSTVKCLSVASAIGGVATKLKVEGKGALLESIGGQTNGTVVGTPQTWSVQSAGQTKLETV